MYVSATTPVADNTTLTLTSPLPSNDTLASSTSSPVTPIRTADFNLDAVSAFPTTSAGSFASELSFNIFPAVAVSTTSETLTASVIP